jgi:histidinol-phosphate aminotransferase
MYATCADGAGGRVVEVPLAPDFEFPLDQVLAAISPMTRIVFITDPHNPTGLPVRREWVLDIARAAPDATIFLDEAYAEFSGRTLIGDPALSSTPNVLIGRTFSKAYGLAAFRAGALVGSGRVLEDVRRILPPFNLNLAATVALPAALSDRRYFESYIANVVESKRLLYQFFDSRGLRYWPSEANFVLVRIGQRATDIVAQLKSRGVYVRDRGSDYGCAGCVRITAGIVQHTRQCIDLLEELL